MESGLEINLHQYLIMSLSRFSWNSSLLDDVLPRTPTQRSNFIISNKRFSLWWYYGDRRAVGGRWTDVFSLKGF